MRELHASRLVVLAALVGVAACTSATVRSSASVLGPEESSVVVRRAPVDAAAELAKLFAARGYTVADYRQTGDAAVIRIAGLRRTLHDEEGRPMFEIGSAFHVFVARHGGAASAVTVIGRPMYQGAELCTGDRRITSACEDPYIHSGFERHLDGSAEAATIHGVLSELRLRGAIDEAAVPADRISLERDLCKARRREAIAGALEHRDVRARAAAHANVTRTLPPCE
jgi:hypothetical protein